MGSDLSPPVLLGTADAEWIDKVHQLLGELWTSAPEVDKVDRMLFTTAVAEIAANIVEHAAAPGPTQVSLSVSLVGDRLEADFRDDGVQLEEDDVGPSPGPLDERGRGLALVRQCVEARYERRDDHNHWQLVRRLAS